MAAHSPSLAPWTTIWAGYQTKGRGQRGNSWESQRNANISLSTWLTLPTAEDIPLFSLSVMTSLALVHIVRHYLPDKEVSIKWPNDIYVQDRKIAGILIENDWEGTSLCHSILGIGLNVLQTGFAHAPNATSLLLEKGKHDSLPPLTTLVEEILETLRCEYTSLLHSPTFSWERYHSLLYRRDGKVYPFEIIKPTQQTIYAQITGVDSEGRLHLYIPVTGERRTFAFKEISYGS